MDKQRQEAHLNLINKLLNCTSDEEINLILTADQDLIDSELIQMMEYMAEVLKKNGDSNRANFFIDLARQLDEELGLSSSSQQLDFLLKILQLTEESQGDAEIIYPLLQQNLGKLDNNLAQLLHNWVTARVKEVQLEQEALRITATTSMFSYLIERLPWGDRTSNLEIAITGYKVATTVITQQAFPAEWAEIQHNLAIAYQNRIRGRKTENLEIAIRYYLAALEVLTHQAFPEKWAEIQNHLGSVYFYRLLGERSENLEIAIRCYLAALQVRTYHTFPEKWADTQNDMGIAYRERIRGKRAENLEAALSCFKAALKIRTFKAFPKLYADTQNNLGNVYLYRIRGERTENMEAAIEHYLAALEIYSAETFPSEWATAQNNLGTAYFYRIEGKKAENIERSIVRYTAALKVYSHKTSPERWATTTNYLSIAYRERILGQSTKNLKTAIDYSLSALSVLSYEAFPQNHAITQFNLGVTYQKAKQLLNSYKTFTAAINAVESLRFEIVYGSGIEEDKQKLAEKWNQLYQNTVRVCVELNYKAQALEYIERSKTRNLVELILTRDRHTIFPAEVVVQLDRLRDEIASSQYELQNATAENPAVLAQHLQQLRQQRNELQDQYLPIGSGFQFEPFRSTLSDRTAIVEFYITTEKLLIFIITQQSPQPIVLSPDLVDLKKLETWANSYLKAYRSKKDHWQRRLTTRLNLLVQILHFDEIIEQIPPECDQLTLIPHRFLHLLPLHVLPLAGNTSLFERFPGGVSYAPSCQLLQLAQTRQRPEFTRLLAVQNPTGDLSYTDIEVETIQSYFNTSNLLKQELATKEAIDETSLNTVHCAHFSCHGYFNASQPRQSALILADARLSAAPKEPDTENYLSLANGGVLDLNKCLTLDKIFTLSLDQCRLVTLSACETGLIDFLNTSDEYIGLSSGFLSAGTPSVVSSLWTVNDLSTAFLMIQFYKNLLNSDRRAEVAIALNQAQLWLRGVTKEELLKWISENKILLNSTLKNNLRRRLHKMSDSDRPFESPFYWAAFCAIGQ